MMRYCCKELMLSLSSKGVEIVDMGNRLACVLVPDMREFRFCPFCGKRLVFDEEDTDVCFKYCNTVTSSPEDCGEPHTYVSDR